MKFVIQLSALCTFCFIFFPSQIALSQPTVPVHAVADHGIEPGYSGGELAEASLYGSIAGEAYGTAKSTATIFQVTLTGPDDPQRYFATKSFGPAKAFQFDRLPPGRYWLHVGTGAGTMIQALPNQQELYVEPGKNYISNVEFRSR